MRRVLAVIAVLLVSAQTAAAQDVQPSWDEWLADLRSEALDRGIRPDIVEAALKDLTPLERVVRADRKQAEFVETAETYIRKRVSQARIDNGQKFLEEHAEILAEVSAAYDVQPHYIVAIWGMETNYGLFKVREDAIRSLATLAYDPRRADFFRRELFAALTILNNGYIDLENMKSSWAGAMGQSQFMPTSYLEYAVDHDGDGHRNIWTSEADVFASIANYLARHGWTGDHHWGEPVTLPENFEGRLAELGTYEGSGCRATRQHSAELPVTTWQAMGVRLKDGGDLPHPGEDASILRVDGDSSQSFIVYSNFRTILRYNCANFYALAVGHLAEAIE
ncbi:MAG: lytic transglycosylase domain-containing protein [Alphaproteobacteria bacterium]